jgi:hypothetical protein
VIRSRDCRRCHTYNKALNNFDISIGKDELELGPPCLVINESNNSHGATLISQIPSRQDELSFV